MRLAPLILLLFTVGCSAAPPPPPVAGRWVLGGGQGYSEVFFRLSRSTVVNLACATPKADGPPRVFMHLKEPGEPGRSVPVTIRIDREAVPAMLVPSRSMMDGLRDYEAVLRDGSSLLHPALVARIKPTSRVLRVQGPGGAEMARLPLAGVADKLSRQTAACRP